jgi:hypothetical protein
VKLCGLCGAVWVVEDKESLVWRISNAVNAEPLSL